jgi:hypothetical protein
MKKTRWFPAETKPVRPGIYETRFDAFHGYSFFNGEKWAVQRRSVAYAIDSSGNIEYSRQDKRWRGLVEQPK